MAFSAVFSDAKGITDFQLSPTAPLKLQFPATALCRSRELWFFIYLYNGLLFLSEIGHHIVKPFGELVFIEIGISVELEVEIIFGCCCGGFGVNILLEFVEAD